MKKVQFNLHKIGALVLCLLLMAGLAPMALARELVDETQPASLTLKPQPESKVLAGVAFSIYKVADVSKNTEYTTTEPFQGYNVALEYETNDEWLAAASTLSGYVLRDNLTPTATGKTDENGCLIFLPLEVGLYLVLGEKTSLDGWDYTPTPFLVNVPSLNDADGWDYNATAYLKFGAEKQPELVSRKVLKVWAKDDTTVRPAEITVQLLRDGTVHDTVTLNAKNNWRHIWDGLDSQYDWKVVEKTVPKQYTVSVSQDGTTFVVTNTYTGTLPTPTPKPGNPTLPQTGMLWWPVPLLAIGGIALCLLGYASRRRGADE